MNLFLLPLNLIVSIHDEVLNPGELHGLAGDKSLAGALGRVENRLSYGMIADVFDLAAAYAVAISQGNCFNDGNKRTAFRTMQTCLDLHGLTIHEDSEVIGQIIIRTAQGKFDEGDLGDWLRARAR